MDFVVVDVVYMLKGGGGSIIRYAQRISPRATFSQFCLQGMEQELSLRSGAAADARRLQRRLRGHGRPKQSPGIAGRLFAKPPLPTVLVVQEGGLQGTTATNGRDYCASSAHDGCYEAVR